MKYRQLGRTGLKVSEIGYGGWGIGQSEWMGAEDELSVRALKAAHDQGVNFFDTALAYGMGHSEQLIARTFGNSTEVVIASKVPPKTLFGQPNPGPRWARSFPSATCSLRLTRR
jgi:aryl-alcohol dehydrogenase-like predicted oxidoreductase